jgi:hypothetical protein
MVIKKYQEQEKQGLPEKEDFAAPRYKSIPDKRLPMFVM